MEKPQIVITGDPETGNVSVTGKLDNGHLMHWLMGEASRIINRHLNEKDAKPEEKPQLVLARKMPEARS